MSNELPHLQHIMPVLCSDNKEHYENLINYVAWMVQHTNQGTNAVNVVSTSTTTNGAHPLIDVMLALFKNQTISLAPTLPPPLEEEHY